MEENKSRNKRSPKLIIILGSILLLTIIFNIILTIKNINDSNNNMKINNNLKNKTEELNVLKEELKTNEEELNSYKNIDESIKKEQEETFANAKKLEDQIINGTNDKKIAYLTFDDGPYANTYRVLEILKDNNVKATFFTTDVNGEYCFDNKSVNCHNLYNEYVKAGHTIANHTYTHSIFYGLYSSTSFFMDKIKEQENLISNLTGGYKTNIMRFPGGSATAKGLKDSIIKELKNNGYGWVDWTAQDGDGGALYSLEQARTNFYNSINDKIEVVLFHDYNNYTTSLLQEFINYLKNNNYILLPLFYESSAINK